MSACIDPITKHIELTVNHTLPGYIKIDSYLALSLINVPSIYIVIENNVPRQMNSTEKKAYDDAHPPRLPPKSYIQIFKELSDATTDGQGERIMAALNMAPIWIPMIMIQDYVSARAIAMQMTSTGVINSNDYVLIDSILPK